MNTTQYYKHNNFLVVQNGDYNDTFDLSKSYVNEFFDITGYLKDKEYSKHHLQRVATLLYKKFNEGDFTFSNIKMYDFTKCIIPNPKVTIEYGDDFTKDLKSRFAFFLNNRFVFAFYTNDTFLSEYRSELTTNQYCEILFTTASKETRNSLNQIIHSLNTLAKYDAN